MLFTSAPFTYEGLEKSIAAHALKASPNQCFQGKYLWPEFHHAKFSTWKREKVGLAVRSGVRSTISQRRSKRSQPGITARRRSFSGTTRSWPTALRGAPCASSHQESRWRSASRSLHEGTR